MLNFWTVSRFMLCLVKTWKKNDTELKKIIWSFRYVCQSLSKIWSNISLLIPSVVVTTTKSNCLLGLIRKLCHSTFNPYSFFERHPSHLQAFSRTATEWDFWFGVNLYVPVSLNIVFYIKLNLSPLRISHLKAVWLTAYSCDGYPLNSTRVII